MQTEVPTLPVVHLNVHKNLNRKENPDLRSSSGDVNTCSSYRSTCLSSNKRCLHPLLGGPYITNTRQVPLSIPTKSNKNSIGQRVLSAKMLRVKQLQNQLADAHYHLNELANENRLLKALQKRQDSALKRYEGTNAELPRIINSHHEELRVLQIKYKKLKALQKDTCESLKEKESELQCLQTQNKHLLQLSKDRNLGEREKLQLQVSDLNHRIQQQQETIQALHRKLTVESKSLKHQLHVEITKRKDTEKNLEEAKKKLTGLESLLHNRERRLYCNGQLPLHNKTRSLGTQSLTNLRDISTSNQMKLSHRDKKWQPNTEADRLPLLNASESNNDDDDNDKRNYEINQSEKSNGRRTETMASLQKLRNFRLQKSSSTRRNSYCLETSEQFKQLNFKAGGGLMNHVNGSEIEGIKNENDANQREIDGNELKRIFENGRYTNYDHSPTKYTTEFDYSTEDTDSEHEGRNLKNDYCTETAKNSRELHARLISSTDEISSATENLLAKATTQYNVDAKLETLLAKELTSDHRSQPEIKIAELNGEKDSYDSSFGLDPELKRQLNGDCYSGKEDNNTFKSSTSFKYNPRNNFVSSVELATSIDANSQILSNEANCTFLNDSQKSRSQNNVNVQARNKDFVEWKYLSNNNMITKIEKENRDVGDEMNDLHSDLENINTQASSSDLQEVTVKSVVARAEELNVKSIQVEGSEALSIGSETVYRDESDTSLRAYEELESSILTKPIVTQANDEFSIDDTTISRKVSLEKTQNFRERQTVMLLDSVETKNKINKEEGEIDTLQINTEQAVRQSHQNRDPLNKSKKTHEGSSKAKAISYNKEKLLATMKAIDNNENIEFLNSEYQKHNSMSRKQVTENLFHGLPTQAKRKQEVIKDIFESDSIESKPREASNLH